VNIPKLGRGSANAALTTSAAKIAANDIRFVPELEFMRGLNTASVPASRRAAVVAS
jgi:hypothetical protein